jgi:hypothetical protein
MEVAVNLPVDEWRVLVVVTTTSESNAHLCYN